jgi:hypothetical protein
MSSARNGIEVEGLVRQFKDVRAVWSRTGLARAEHAG